MLRRGLGWPKVTVRNNNMGADPKINIFTHVIDALFALVRGCLQLFQRPISYLLDLGLTKELMSDDEFDNIPDDFADAQDIDWAHLLAAPSLSLDTPPAWTQADSIPPHSNNLDSSSSYFSDDDMDASFLAELDRVEQTVVAAPYVTPHSGEVISSPT